MSDSGIVNGCFLCLVAGGIAVLLYAWNFGIPFGGPITSLYVENEKWEKLSMKYWVVTDISDKHNWIENERTLELSCQDLEHLKMTFKTSSGKGSALGNPCHWILKTDKNEWFMELEKPNHAFLCLTNNTDWAFSVQLKSADFHALLRQMCYNYEKESNPDIEIENIRICRRGGWERIVPTSPHPTPLPEGEGILELL